MKPARILINVSIIHISIASLQNIAINHDSYISIASLQKIAINNDSYISIASLQYSALQLLTYQYCISAIQLFTIIHISVLHLCNTIIYNDSYISTLYCIDLQYSVWQ